MTDLTDSQQSSSRLSRRFVTRTHAHRQFCSVMVVLKRHNLTGYLLPRLFPSFFDNIWRSSGKVARYIVVPFYSVATITITATVTISPTLKHLTLFDCLRNILPCHCAVNCANCYQLEFYIIMQMFILFCRKAGNNTQQ